MSSVEARIQQWFTSLRQVRHPLLTGDPAGEPVLRELVNDPSPHVQALARIGMQNIEAKQSEMQRRREVSPDIILGARDGQ